MAKVTFIDPIDTLSGKIAKRHRTMYSVRSAATSNREMLENPCYTSAPRKSKKPASASVIAARERFTDICAATLERMMDPNHIAMDQLNFRQQNKYLTLRQYVWHVCAEAYDGK